MCRVRKKAGRAGQERKEKDMFTMLTENTRRVTSAVAAVAVVAFAGLALDQGHAGSLPEGTVEVGEMTPVNLMQLAMVTLPEVVVTGERIEAGQVAAQIPELPGIVVYGSRSALLADAGTDTSTQG
jgi:hypothetical protein